MKRHTARCLSAGLAIAVLLRVGLLLLFRYVGRLQSLLDIGDAIGYNQLARSILESTSFRFVTGEATAFRMPGYPLFLAGVYSIWDSTLAVQLTQILFDAVTIGMVYIVACEVTQQRTIGCLAAIIIAANPLLMLTSLMLIPETLATAALTVGIWALLRILHATSSQHKIRWMVLLFLALAAGIYLKPTIAAVSLLASIMLFLRLRRDGRQEILRVFSVAAGVTLVVLSPWIVRNYVVMEAFVPLSTSNGANLYGGNNPKANGGYVSDLPYVLPGMKETESSAVLAHRAADWIVANPARFLALLPRKAARHWSPLALGTAGYSSFPLIIQSVAIIVFTAFYLLAIFGCMTLIRNEHQWKAVALLLVPLTLFTSSLVAFGATRFALPSYPELAILSALGIAKLYNKLAGMWQR